MVRDGNRILFNKKKEVYEIEHALRDYMVERYDCYCECMRLAGHERDIVELEELFPTLSNFDEKLLHMMDMYYRKEGGAICG